MSIQTPWNDENTDESTAQFIRHFIANGTVGMLREWVNKGFPVNSRRIAELMYYLSEGAAKRGSDISLPV